MNDEIGTSKEVHKYEEEKQKRKQRIVRNEYRLVGECEVPLIKKQNIDLDKIELCSYSGAKYNDVKNKNKTIHFFLYDYRFEHMYSNARKAVEKLVQYYAICTPDFSIYTDMPIILQMYSVFKNRWCEAFLQSQGLKVIPTISWGDDRSFGFCFEGIEIGSIVAVSTLGNRKCKDEFMLGYNKMLEKIKPCAILCYGKPFEEMKGNLIIFPYKRREGNEVNV